MSDLYHTDILEWSERQGALLRRIAAGERVNDTDLDWPNIAEEIESVGNESCPEQNTPAESGQSSPQPASPAHPSKTGERAALTSGGVNFRRRSPPIGGPNCTPIHTQHEHMNFADAFCIRLATLKNWEQGTRKADEDTYAPNTGILTLYKTRITGRP
jgi:hypothetical protein